MMRKESPLSILSGTCCAKLILVYCKPKKAMMITIERKFKEGEIVVDRIRPNQPLVIKKIDGNIYHCTIVNQPHRSTLFYFEKDIKGSTATV
jgi:hypothetical protein